MRYNLYHDGDQMVCISELEWCSFYFGSLAKLAGSPPRVQKRLRSVLHLPCPNDNTAVMLDLISGKLGVANRIWSCKLLGIKHPLDPWRSERFRRNVAPDFLVQSWLYNFWHCWIPILFLRCCEYGRYRCIRREGVPLYRQVLVDRVSCGTKIIRTFIFKAILLHAPKLFCTRRLSKELSEMIPSPTGDRYECWNVWVVICWEAGNQQKWNCHLWELPSRVPLFYLLSPTVLTRRFT